MKEEKRPDPELYVDAFARGLAVIRAFDAAKPVRSLAEVAEAVGISRASARRLLGTLVHLGYVQADVRGYRLSPKVMQLGYAYLSGLSFSEIVEHYVVDLAEKTNESCSVCVLDDVEVVYTARASTRKIISVNLAIGARLPAWATATGRVLLAGLDDAQLGPALARCAQAEHAHPTRTDHARLAATIMEVRANGYAYTAGELELGLTAIAVPVVDRHGRTVAAMNVAGHVQANSREHMLNDNLPLLRQAAQEINAALAARGMA
ncbi:IclR family transcriptional regulator C-terminal domain-containing protein [Massilia sp. YIM B02763]|uniref:IclR family transcriptional regulator domain-containing protein n=1 Tax=Massilia sp. YIM B02763 TaxID=3050130 RepID=UPI0025B72147|nr:IclR family transcriptional regulator C-terminal domain-containing protein [Massilia sp. YIM B02763]MDN4055013.1 IclR family transcriptional regulator C-terminal domain-containing protein [Massilia sp. YIM B02763]